MNTLPRFLPTAGKLLAGCILLGMLPAWSQPMPLTNAIPPTVTAAMGDVGGKAFGRAPDPAKTRHYYIAAEPELWNYAPEGRDPICGKPLPPPVVTQPRGGKFRYVQYIDETFGAKLIHS